VTKPWSPDSWKSKPAVQIPTYEDEAELAAALAKLHALPPLVTSWEIERLRELIAEAQDGKRFVLQGGDCAESLADCRSDVISNQLKILLQMSLVLVHGAKKPIVRVGRFAGQYAKPRSQLTETRKVGDQEQVLPSYFGDLVNDADFEPSKRRIDPGRLVQAYQHAAMTLNFIRSLTKGGFADLHHPEYWDLSFLERANLPESLRESYQRTSNQLADALRFMEALGETSVQDLTRVEFFTSHEGLNLYYEAAQTRTVPRRRGYYNLTTHLPWIGERTRDPKGAHIEFFRGVRNPVGIKVSQKADPADVVELCQLLNPGNEAGKILLIVRMGAQNIDRALPAIIEAVQSAKQRVLWVSDPMHGNTETTGQGVKTRNFNNILEELERSFEVHEKMGTFMGGVHFELTGADVTECVGGASGITESDLDRNYASLCDPRLNYGQALEMAFRLASRLGDLRHT